MAVLPPDLEEILHERWKHVLADKYVHPRLSKKPRLSDKVDTACFDLSDLSTDINPEFLKKLVDDGLNLETAIDGLLDHEVGHYVLKPGDVATALIYAEAAERYYPDESKGIKGNILNDFFDCAVNLRRMGRSVSGKELRELIKNTTCGESSRLTFDVLSGFYDDRLSFFESPFFKSEEYLNDKDFYDDKIKQLRSVDFYNKGMEGPYLNMFGEIIMDLLKRDQEDQGSGEGNVLKDMDGMFDKISDKDIMEALDKIAAERGIYDYEKIKDFIEKEKGKDYSKGKGNNEPLKNKMAGLGSSDLEWNNHLVDYYKRKAIGVGIYVHKKPLIVSVANSYPEGSEKYTVGDPFHSIIAHSSPWILPGITQKNKQVHGIMKDEKHGYPHLWLSIDSSGSMDHPSYLSYAVLSGFVLANNYHVNGSKIGVMNFSCDSAMLFPTRNLNDVYELLCAYYGGGTVFDPERVKDFFKIMSKKGLLEKAGLKGITLSKKEDYEKLISQLDPMTRKELEKKEVNVSMDREVKEFYKKIDHVLITDGGLFNLEEVIGYFNNTAEYTRNYIIVVDNYHFAEETAKLGLEKTQVINVNNGEELLGIALGRAKSMKPK